MESCPDLFEHQWRFCHTRSVRLEHFALQVPEPAAMADWYVKHLGFKVARAGDAPAHARFILDSAGLSMIEIYHNPSASLPDYQKVHPLHLHLAVVTEDPKADRDRLVTAGAKLVEDHSKSPAGDEFVMLRDPWNVPLQLVKRAEPMLKQ
jgi:uncharacterized glyoxalase superfamily protein PhnB